MRTERATRKGRAVLTQHPKEPRASAPHLRLKVKIYPDHEPTRAEVAEICRQVREFCASMSPAFHPAVDIMEGYGMGHADPHGSDAGAA
jgi:hypothetical protein